jgi:preprotein translocase subunit SecA
MSDAKISNAMLAWYIFGKSALPEDMPSMPCKPEPRIISRPAPVGYGKRINRNAPCPCGSGKKFKKCCFITPAEK